MPIPGLPPGASVQVLLDDGTGTYPTDVTADVRFVDGITVSSYGRGDEFSTATAANLSFTLDNETGTYSTGAGALSPRQGVRVRANAGAGWVDRFTGTVAALNLGWPQGGQEFSTVTVTATDALATTTGFPLRSMLEQETLLHGPLAYYTLSESSGSSAGDTSGNAAPTLTSTGTGAAFTMGTGTGPVDGLTATTFAAGKYLACTPPNTPSTCPTVFAIGAWFSTTSTSPDMAALVSMWGWRVSFDVFDTFFAVGPGTGDLAGGAFADGDVHLAVVTGDGTTATLYIDGVATASHAVTSGLPLPNTDLRVGDTFQGTLSHVFATDSHLTAADVSDLFALTTTETTADRFARLCSYTGQANAITTGMSGQQMPVQATSGQSAADALQDVAAAEGGVLYADGSGTLVLQGRYYRAQQVTPALTLTADDVDPDTSVVWDTQQLLNQVTASRPNGASIVVGATTGQIFTTDLSLIVDTDAAVTAHAQWVVTKHENTTPRIGSLTFDLLTTDTATRTALLGLDIGARIALSGMPSQLWAGTGDLTIEGWTETVSADQWTLTCNVQPWELERAWVLGDSTYGVLGTTTTLGY